MTRLPSTRLMPTRPAPRRLVAVLCLLTLLFATVAPGPLAAQQRRDDPRQRRVPVPTPADEQAREEAEQPKRQLSDPEGTVADPELFDKSLQVAYHTLEQYGTYDNPEEQRRVADIAYAVAREAGFDSYPFTFHLVDMPEPNAFALPGGHIFITRGMLDLGLDDDMLAALLGHEIAHVVEEHYLEMRKKATLMSILSSVLQAGVLIAAKNSSERRGPYNPYDPTNADRGSSTGDLIQGASALSLVVSELLMRSYSRENETESDVQGQRWAAAAGYDPMGAAELMSLMGSRIPQNKRYGYWMTHPFFDERVRAAKANGELIKVDGDPGSAEEYRRRTQDVLVGWIERGNVQEEMVPLVERQALVAWPRGEVAEGLRLKRLHRLRTAELEQPALSRDFGKLVRAYRQELVEVRSLTPESPFLEILEKEIHAFEAEAEDLYPKAAQVLEEGFYETAFLETFLSNYPQAPQVPKVALELGDSHSRLQHQTEAVRHYLLAWETAPESPEGRRAARGLRALAPRLDGLAALQQLALQDRDPELAAIARQRLGETAAKFGDIANGSDYLRRFPDGPHVEQVLERINVLASNLLGEVVLYQAVGDHVKAIERINQILTHAPSSEAAEQLRDRAVFDA